MSSCDFKVRKIIVLNLKRNQLNPIEVDYSNCKGVQSDIQYEIIYKEIVGTITNSSELFTQLPLFLEANKKDLNDVCNTMLIYGEQFPILLMKHVLTKLNPFAIPKTLYYVISTEDIDTVIKTLQKFNLKKIRVFQPLIWLENFYKKLNMDNTYEENSRLTCQPWFQKFISTVFGCGKGRLIQISGTCYLNSVINSILLTRRFKNIVIEAMLRFMEKNPKLSKEIERPFEDEKACPLLSEKTNTLRLLYIFRAVYSILKQKRISNRAGDLLLEASKRYFSVKTTHFFRPSIQGTWEGGFDFFVMYTFLLNSGINFCILTDLGVYMPPKLIEKDIQLLRMARWSKLDVFDYSNMIEAKDLTDVDVLITLGINSFPQVPGYKLETAGFSIIFANGGSHAVCGFTCGDTYKMFDSNNFIYDIDWRYLDDVSFLTEFKRQISISISQDVESISPNYFILCKETKTIKFP